MDIFKPAGAVAVLDSITHATEAHRGKVLIAGSHGGDYCGWYAVHAGLRAVVLHDAGVGLEQAGIRSLSRLERAGMPAATVSYLSARIGDGWDMAGRGVVSFCNDRARALDVAAGMPAALAARLLAAAGDFDGTTSPRHEARQLLASDNGHGLEVVGLDSNSLVNSGDAGRIVVTGSHGGLLGGRVASAIGKPVRAAAYNDAGGGIDGAGYSRLPALDARGIPAMTVHHYSARIGEARSSWETGVVSRANAAAALLGVRPGMTLQDAVGCIR